MVAVVRSDSPDQGGPARIVTFSSGSGSRNFTLGQDGGELVFLLRTPSTGQNGSAPEVRLGTLPAGEFHHLAITYSPGNLRYFLDGSPALESDLVGGDLSNWEGLTLLVGDESNGGRDWAGALERLAIFNRALPAEEIAALAAEAKAVRAGWEAIPSTTLRARIIEQTPTPHPSEIGSYLRVLATSVCEVEEVLAGGAIAPGRILVSEWAIMDRTPLPDRPKAGSTVELVVEPFELHPQLESEKLVSDSDDFSLPNYYVPASAWR